MPGPASPLPHRVRPRTHPLPAHPPLPQRRTLSLRRLAPLLVAPLFLGGCADPAEAPPPAACEVELVQLLDTDRVMEHIRVLTVDIGPRVASSPQEREAAEYLAGELRSMGYEVEIQDFARPGLLATLSVEGPGDLRLFAAVGRIRGVPAAEFPRLTGPEGVRGPVVACGAGPCPEGVAGGIALLAPSEEDAGARIRAAAQAGAAGVLLHGPDWRRFGVTLDEDPGVPFATVNLDAAEALQDAGEVTLTLAITFHEGSQNVIATRPVEGRPDAPVVIFTAHYDSVEKAPGASDNASGTAGMLELARILAEVPVEAELRFAAVGAEEVGLVGSRYYVAQLPEEERARIVANYNMDMIGTAGEAQTQLFVNTLDGDNLVARTARMAREALGYPEDLLRAPFQRGASDHVAFADAGIPAANFIWREPETINLEPWYHHPYDTIERISEDRIHTALRIVLGAATHLICQGPEGLGAEEGNPATGDDAAGGGQAEGEVHAEADGAAEAVSARSN